MDIYLPKLCEYGCGQEAKFQFKNGKWCCSEKTTKCPEIRKKVSKSNKGHIVTEETKKKISKANKNQSIERREISSKVHKGKTPWNKGKTGIYSKETLKKMRKARKGKTYKEIFGKEKAKVMKEQRTRIRLTISKIKKKYPFFAQIEEMRYNPDKPGEKEIQVHCKNHLCSNSKERGGWFTPTNQQMKTRRDWLENEGIDICYFYCSKKCKESCPLYRLKGKDPYIGTEKPYTQQEYQQFREFVLKRDNYKCQYCGEKAIIIHHERPQKLEPFFALDPDLAWSVCKKCHYKYGHKTGTECSTNNLANKIC